MKPQWLKKKLHTKGVVSMKNQLRHLQLHTVCEEASCPNLSECFSQGVATVMIMGDTCTRSCKFCAVKTGRPAPLDSKEPKNVALWLTALQLKYVVITSVDRDDLSDFGANHFAKTVTEVRKKHPQMVIEVLTPDFQGQEELIKIVCDSKPNIFNHNLETTRRLTSHVRSASDYQRSLNVLKWVKEHYPNQTTKSGMMLGLGETKNEVIQALKDLKNNGCDLLTLGQYLQPTKNNLAVYEYIHPDQFDEYKQIGISLGFKAVFSGPFVRSSYLAESLYMGAKRSLNLPSEKVTTGML